jgi:hypothetical protein
MDERFQIDERKLTDVRHICFGAGITDFATMDEFIQADWPNGDEHQVWLNNASAREIASWVIAGLK